VTMALHGYTPLNGDESPEHVLPDWDKARKMINELESAGPNVDHIPDWHEAIGIYLEDGTKIFAIRSDGTTEVPFPDRLDEAAVIFFRNVVEIAKLQGYGIRKSPDLNPEGWDA
jgi:hypothetical protein